MERAKVTKTVRLAAYALLIVASVALAEEEWTKGKYIGDIILSPVQADSRLMTVEAPFSFIDRNGKEWRVAADVEEVKTDGASIPWFLWSSGSTPFIGKHREASIVHDYFCNKRPKGSTSRAVHRMFYNALRVSGVKKLKANMMYAAVYEFGPKWPKTSVAVPNMACNSDLLRMRCVRPSERHISDPESKVPKSKEEFEEFLRRRGLGDMEGMSIREIEGRLNWYR